MEEDTSQSADTDAENKTNPASCSHLTRKEFALLHSSLKRSSLRCKHSMFCNTEDETTDCYSDEFSPKDSRNSLALNLCDIKQKESVETRNIENYVPAQQLKLPPSLGSGRSRTQAGMLDAKTEPLDSDAGTGITNVCDEKHEILTETRKGWTNCKVYPLALFQNFHPVENKLDSDSEGQVNSCENKHTKSFEERSSKKPYHCSVCSSSFGTRAAFEKHICFLFTKSGEKRYSCDKCSYTFLSVAKVQQHAKKHAGVKPYQCLVCQKFFSSDSHLQAHIKKNHIGVQPCQDPITVDTESKTFCCSKCPATFKSQSSLRRHARAHREQETEAGQPHAERNEGPKFSFKCRECPSAFSTKVLMMKHCDTHRHATPYKCPFCHERLASPSSLKSHAESHPECWEKLFHCPKCSFIFLKQTGLKKHLMEDHGEKLYECVDCSCKFSRKTRLKFHMMLHAKERTFKCPNCTHSFSTQTCLNRHMKSHKQRKVKCSKCSSMFTTAENLKRHFEQHVNEVSFLCSKCPASFNSLRSLQGHVRKHRDKLSLVCQMQASAGSEISHQKKLKLVIRRTDQNAYTCSMPQLSSSDETDGNTHSQDWNKDTPHTEHSSVDLNQQSKTFSEKDNRLCPDTDRLFQNSSHATSCSGHNTQQKLIFPCSQNHVGQCRPSSADHKDACTEEICLAELKQSSTLSGSGTSDVNNVISQLEMEHLSSPLQQVSVLSIQDLSKLSDRKEDIPMCPSSSAPLTQKSSNLLTQKQIILAVKHAGAKPPLQSPMTTFNQQTQVPAWRDPNRKPYKCPKCSSVFKYPSDLKIHIRIHTGEKPYQCPQCPRAFKSNGELTSHSRTHKEERPHQCSVCSSSFTCPSDLKIHSRIHSGERPYQCSQCSRAFKSVSELNSHTRTHSEDRPFKCTECPSSFRRMSDLKVHTRIHSGEKPYLCSQCASAFKSVGELRSHSKTHTEDKPFQCLVCPSAFRSASDLKVHTRTHTGEKPYLCSHCPAAFKSVGELNSHTKRAHQDNCKSTLS